MEAWASRLYERMVSAGKKPADLARACGIKPGSVSGWFGQGKPTKMISGNHLVVAAELLGTTAEYVMTGRRGAIGRGVEPGTESDLVSQPARLEDENIAQGIELLYLLADARPDDRRFERLSWARIQIAAKAVRTAEGSQREAMAKILAELSEET